MGRLFGTDGVRGIANSELTPELALRLGRAAATVLGEGLDRRPLILIGCDTRISSSMLCSAAAAGICSAGADVKLLGVVPTPAVAYLVRTMGADAGVMISASHNPFDYNGIKIFGSEGYKLPDELEETIEALILDADKADAHPLPSAERIGVVSEAYDALDRYLDYIKACVGVSFEGLSVAIDCANGSSAVTARRIFTDLGAKVHMLHDAPNGVNINLNCGSTHMESLARAVVEGGFDCGLAFDGDADRFLCIDEKGELVDGDQIMAVCALDLKSRGRLPHDTVVGTIMTNFGFTKFCEDNGFRFIATKVGDRFVLEEMLLGRYAIGGEQSGHIIFREHATTGDGQLTALQLLAILKKQKKPLSELCRVMTKYPQYMVNLKVTPEGKIQFFTDPEIKKAIAAAEELLAESGRVVVRPSGTEPLIRVMAEAGDHALAQKAVDDLAAVIRARVGRGE